MLNTDQQVFELYYEAALTAAIPDGKRWLLDVCQD
jgi:hypothetical protein